MNDSIDRGWRDFPPNPHGLRMRYRISSHSVEFAGFERGIPGQTFDQGSLEVDEQANITGAVNWEGCINWSTSGRTQYHFCDPQDVEYLGLMFAAAWRLAERHVEFWIKDIVLTCPNPLPAEA